jgi:hypothetical protein
LVDTEGFVLKVKVHSEGLGHEGIKPLLERAGEPFSRLSYLWLDSGYRGEDKSKNWVEKAVGWTVELVERPQKPAPKRCWWRGPKSRPRKARSWIGRNYFRREGSRSYPAVG